MKNKQDTCLFTGMCARFVTEEDEKKEKKENGKRITHMEHRISYGTTSTHSTNTSLIKILFLKE